MMAGQGLFLAQTDAQARHICERNKARDVIIRIQVCHRIASGL